jgi:uracil-DNA glycosylase
MTPQEHFGASWFERLKHALESPEINALANKIATLRKSGVEIYPSRENVFRAFRETPFNTVKVVWFAQDPYNDVVNQATGLCMDCGVYPSNTIKKVYEVYNKDFPNNFAVDIMEGKLERWAHQGVLLLNASLTVEKKKPGSHLELWKPFTKIVLTQLVQDLTPKVFVGLGNVAQRILGNIPAPHHLLKYEHPVAASYDGRSWKAEGIFHEINKRLKFNGITEIDW